MMKNTRDTPLIFTFLRPVIMTWCLNASYNMLIKSYMQHVIKVYLVKLVWLTVEGRKLSQ